MQNPRNKPVFRFAPSPNGHLHLGHAYSALVNFNMARRTGGLFLLRIEDIDITRCTAEYEQEMLEDLQWLGISWDEKPRRQSDHFEDFQSALDSLELEELLYPAFMSRSALRQLIGQKEAAGENWPRDPDGAPIYPGTERKRCQEAHQFDIDAGNNFALRLDMGKALERIPGRLFWEETGSGPDGQNGHILCDPNAWGDVILGRKEIPASYHLSVVIDDALQGITQVVRGRDLYHATSVHRLLQELLGLAAPSYHHHQLILAADGRKLSKSDGDTSLRALRQTGATPNDIRRMVGLKEA